MIPKRAHFKDTQTHNDTCAKKKNSYLENVIKFKNLTIQIRISNLDLQT